MTLARNVHKTLLTGWIACLCLVIVGGIRPASGEPADAVPFFLVDSPFDPPALTRIYQVDPATGVMVLRADLGGAHTPSLALAAASDTVLYAAATDSSEALCQGASCLLLRIVLDPSSTTPMSVTVVGPMLAGGSPIGEVTGLTFRSDGSLYALSQSSSGIYIVDPATAAATLVGMSNADLHGGDLTFDAEDRLWAWTNGQVPGFYELDPATALATAVDLSTGENCAGMAAVGHTNEVYAASTFNDSLHEIVPGVGRNGHVVPLSFQGLSFDHKRGDLDSPHCAAGSFCDDGDACTDDGCEPGGCRHARREGCCVSSVECDDGNPCTDDACTGDAGEATCTHTPLDGGEIACGTGSCRRTAVACVGGAPQACEPGSPVGETCNGEDDDCDGATDEDVPAPTGVPSVTLSGGAAAVLSWTAVSGATDYDIVTGDLGALAATHGDFASSTAPCLASRVPGFSAGVQGVPPAGAGAWFLVRPGNCSARGTWDEPGDSALAAPRDAGIQASAASCP